MFAIKEVTDGLLISSKTPVTNENLRKLHITCVVDATDFGEACYDSDIELVRVKVADAERASIAQYFESTAAKILEHRRKGGRTLVHCLMGKSRSATLCLAYLMRVEQCSLRDAYLRLYAARPAICPNLGFWQQLIEFEQTLFGKTTVSLIDQPGQFPSRIPDVVREQRDATRARMQAAIAAK